MEAFCRFCQKKLVSGIELKMGACVDCAGRELAAAEQANARVPELIKKLQDIESKVSTYRKLVQKQTEIHEAQKEGSEAQERGATLDDNPYHPDDDSAAAWSHGWLSREVYSQVGKAQATIAWAISDLEIVRELALGGTSGDELVAKIDNVIQKLAQYMPGIEDPPR